MRLDFVDLGYSAQECRVELRADDGGDAQELLGGGAQPTDAAAYHIVHAVRQGDRTEVVR